MPTPAAQPERRLRNLLHPVVLQGISKTYRLDAVDVPALVDINLVILPDRFTVISGPSGSGKTTLLNCISSLDQPTAGAVYIFGEEISRWPESRRTTWRREQVGFIFQSLGLLPVLSAYENVELVLRLNGVGAKARHKAAVDALELVGLTRWIDHRPYELSGGQQQRVAIARALAASPRLLIADEPTANLDSKTAHSVLALFRSIVRERNVTMLMATHDTLADDYVDRVVNLSDGRIVSG